MKPFQLQHMNGEHAVWFESENGMTDKRPWFGELKDISTDDFSFAVLGDRCGMATAGVFEKALETVRDLKPDFVLSVGDLIEGYWREASYARAEWDEIDHHIEACGMPFFQIVGNHDCGSQMMLDVWRERKGFEYYAFRIGDILYLMLNTEDPPSELPDAFIDIIKKATFQIQHDPARTDEHMQAFYQDILTHLPKDQLQDMARIELSISDEQLDFARRILEEHADARWTFVSMHKPGWKSEDPQFKRLEEMLGSRSHTIFAGHLHAMEYSSKGNGEYIQLGRTGGHAHGTGPESQNVMLWVNMRGGKPTYRVIQLDGVQEAGHYKPSPSGQHLEPQEV